MSTTWTPQEFYEGFTEEQQITLRTAFRALQEGLERAKPYDTLRVLHAAPSKVFAGMLVNADGTDWNPGSGAGLYLRNEANTAWNLVGLAVTEGTFTPSGTFVTAGDFAVTWSTATGSYTRIGDQVTATIQMTSSSFTHTTASGEFRITGLPFTVDATAGSSGDGDWGGITKAGYTDLAIRPIASTTTARIAASGSGVAVSSVTAADMPTGGTVRLVFTVIYTAA